MKTMQTLLLSFVIGFNTIGWDCTAQSETIPMNHFADRARIYSKWLHGKVTREEYAVVKETIIKDGIIAVLFMVTIGVGGIAFVEWLKRKSVVNEKELIDSTIETIKSNNQKVIRTKITLRDYSIGISLTSQKITCALYASNIDASNKLFLNNYPLFEQFIIGLRQIEKYQNMPIEVQATAKDANSSTSLVKYDVSDEGGKITLVRALTRSKYRKENKNGSQ